MLTIILAATALAATQLPPGIPERLAEAQAFAKASGDSLWPGYGEAPFGFLLVGGDTETLMCREQVPEGFSAAGTDSATGCSEFTRPRSGLPNTLLAALPIFGPPSTIVMGMPESTGRDEANWTRTILHEHFHQWQDSFPNIFERMRDLGLAGDDKTGMWMLNYPFPYDRPTTLRAFEPAAKALSDAVAARGTPRFPAALSTYVAKRKALAAAVGERKWRYAELELWKEGVARWTEIELGKEFPDPNVRASALALNQKTRAWLDKPDLAGAGREFVYPYGASEAMLLQACDPNWRTRYSSVLALGPLLEEAAARCDGGD